ncbi:MAG TPA: tail fiber domain-containing protein [Parafilimonas sp.]|nr:tail fiber domain-containing protein [Parafilimonas sp.]
MKNKNFLFIMTLFCAATVSVNAQSWSLTGNAGTAQNRNFIGTTDNKPLVFRTKNLERMRILNNGLVGIGTKTPTNPLHVVKGLSGAAGYVDASLVLENNIHNYINILAPSNFETGILFGKPSASTSGGIIYNSAVHPNGFQFRTDNNVVRMVLSGSGNLGIGTVFPEAYRLRLGVDLWGFNIFNNFNQTHWEQFVDEDFLLYYNNVDNLVGRFDHASGTYTAASDERLKTNIKPMTSVLDKINRLKPSTYQFKKDKNGKEYNGMIAQEVMKVFPSLVSHYTNKDRKVDVYTMDYSGFGVIAIKGIQELQTQVKEQQEKINSQDRKIEDLTTLVKQLLQTHASSTDNSLLKNANSAVKASLEQNAPNPFTQNTVINYYVPQTAGRASINITDINGRLIKTVTAAKGNGKITIEKGQLNSGTYVYSLYVDGNVVHTKQMVLTR